MADTVSQALVRQWRERLRGVPLARGVIAGLDRRSPEIWRRTVDLLRQESPEYRNSIDEEFTNESRSHCGELLRSIIAIAEGRARMQGDPFHFVRTHAEWRAGHRVPLVASLHAYRLAHKTYSDITQEVLLRHPQREQALHALSVLSTFWIEFFDHVGAVLAEAHVTDEAKDGRESAELMRSLLRGELPQPASMRLCGLTVPMAIAVARPFAARDGKPADVEVTLRSVARLLLQSLPASAFGRMVEIQGGEVVAVVSRQPEPARALLAALRRNRFGRTAGKALGAGLGISLDTAEIARLPESLEEARAALDFTSSARPVLHFAEVDLPEFLVRHAGPVARRLIPAGVMELATDLVRTMRVFAECSLNVKQTATRLSVHTNTVYFRLNRIHQLTGIDPRTFAGASTLTAALRLREIPS